ncbi:MAG: GEVED domain-containing protein [Bacteroidota bacterium]|nr:GEVED domain-containing protein [Bacteroidota bacterium]
MKKVTLFVLLFSLVFASGEISAQKKRKKDNPNVDYRIDNMGYWGRMVEKGYVEAAPEIKIPEARYTGSALNLMNIKTEDSPDVPVHDEGNTTQSETSIFVDPSNNSKVFNSNNSTSWTGSSVGTVYGTSSFFSHDFAATFFGTYEATGGSNSGDPAALISLDGRYYSGFIHSNSGQGVAYSTDEGTTWTSVVAGTTSGSMLDKNHLWVDNSPISPHTGNVYDAWTDFGGSMDEDIGFVRSTDGGLTYSSAINLSSAVNAGSHNQGVNINSGPNGNVYVVWAIYDDWYGNGYEEALGFAKSTDGGETFTAGTRIIENLRGVRPGVSKNQRVNSFPVMAVDQQTGTIYVVWANQGVPGDNTGTNKSIYISKSTDEGDTWSAPSKVNQGPADEGKEAYLPWITCDPETGTLSVIYYDDRNVSSTEVEPYVSVSYDGGESWEDMKVGDVAFTPSPISGLAGGYMGDYLGISARGGMVYPVWPDNRNGYVQSFVSVFETNSLARPENLNAVLTDGTGQVDLSWTFSEAKALDYFKVYRDGVLLETTTETTFTDMLPEAGEYNFGVSAMHTNGESSVVYASVSWGSPQISVDPTSLSETLLVNQTSTRIITVENTGNLPLTYDMSSSIISKSAPKVYCDASGGGDEYISGVEFAGISNTGTSADGYADYTAMEASLDAGNTYDITITNGNSWSSDDLGIWADWNQDGDFEDTGENVVCTSGDGADGVYSFTVPDGALGGNTTLRIRIKYSGSDCGSPCGATSYGEVEDYGLVINSWLQVGESTGNLYPGTTEEIPVTYNSQDLAEGTYNANITFNSNDSENPSIVVPVTLVVSATAPLAAEVYASESLVCSGSELQLFANAVGGSGVYSYTWSSVPAGFTSDIANPTVTPAENTQYFVEVDDGIETVSGSTSITINNVPTQAAAPTGDEISFCQGGGNTAYSTTGASNANYYIWEISSVEAGDIDGEQMNSVVSWNPMFSGNVNITVTAVNQCGEGTTSDALPITVEPQPDVLLDMESDFCIDEASITLEGGSPIGGTYFVDGTEASEFDPATIGVGSHSVSYYYSNGTCDATAYATVSVNELPIVSLDMPVTDVSINQPTLVLEGGTPAGGVYSGTGVVDGIFYPSDAGVGFHTITYTYEDNYGCMAEAVQELEVSSTIQVETTETLTLEIYPNPVTNVVYISIESLEQEAYTIEVYNQLGMTVYQKTIEAVNSPQTAIDLSDYANGMYFISLRSDNFNTVKRIVKQ